MERGLITGIYWPGRYAYVTKADGTPVKASWLTGFPPPPRAVVWLEQPVPGVWLIVGGEADRRVVLHDDFFRMNQDVATVIDGDTSWWWQSSGGGAIATDLATTEMGVATITSPGGTGAWIRLTKAEAAMRIPAAPAAAWMSARIQFSTLTGTLAMVGFANNATQGFLTAGANEIHVGYDSTLTPGFVSDRIGNGAVHNQVGSTIPISAGTFYHIDLLVQGGGAPWAAWWIDGQGPQVRQIGIPTGSLQPDMQVYNRDAATRTLLIDWYHLERVAAVLSP